MKITPVLMVDEIEKSLPFWIGRIGFTKTVDVPEGDRLGFVILVKDGAELMLQTIESVQARTGHNSCPPLTRSTSLCSSKWKTSATS